MANKQIRDVMTPNPRCVSEQDSIRDAARIMKEQDTGVVPVVDGKKIIGLITDRDIVVRGLADGKDLGNAHVSDLMSKDVRSIRDDARVDEALDLMSNAEVRRVPVVDRNDEIVGIVSLGDLATDTDSSGRIGRAVEDISEAPPNN